MRPTLLSRTRRWLGASALALLVGIGGVSTAFVLTGQAANAQVRNAAQIVVPQVNQQQGFADLVDAVKPAVVSILVEAEEPAREEVRTEAAADHEAAGETPSIYEPVENPFVRETRPRGLKPRRDRSRRDEEPGEAGETGGFGLDPSLLPPAISAGRGDDEPIEAGTEEAAEERPRRRTRRPRPPADDAGEALEAVS